MSGLGRLGLVPREVGSIGSIPAKTGLHQDKMRNKSRMNEKSAQGQVFITSASPYLRPPSPGGEGTRSGGLRGAGLRLPSPAGRRCRAAADEGGAGPRPVPPLTRPSARPRKRGSPLSRRERDRAAADEGHSCRRDCSLIRLQGLRSHLVGAEYLGDSFNNSLQAMEDLVIGDSDHPQPKAHEPGFPATITGPSVGMAVAVNLQDQTRGMTVEVHDVRSDHHLPTKLPTRQATVAESLPD